METFDVTLEKYIKSDDFVSGVVSATKASWAGDGFSVELFNDRMWMNRRNSDIGNKYLTPGVLLPLPTLSEGHLTFTEGQEEVRGNDQALRQLVELEHEDLANELREALAFKTARQEQDREDARTYYEHLYEGGAGE